MTTLHALRLAPNVPVFDLPVTVGIEQGIFKRYGLDVRFVGRYDPITSNVDAFQRQKESLYECGKADAYNLCEWAGLDRSDRSALGSRVHALRPAVVAQVLLSFDPAIQEVGDLAGVPVGVNELTGSYYTTLQFLGGALPRDQVVLEHVGEPFVRYEALKSGRLRVASLMEPYVSLALKEGAHIIAVNFYRGAEVISPDLAPQLRQAYLHAVNEAADLLQAGFDRYRHHLITDAIKERLQPEEIGRQFVRYAHSRPMDEGRFAYTSQWMDSWDLKLRNNVYDKLVVA